MTLASGSRLGPYEITGRLGAGGMGEVYRARDTRLGRDVAVKVLPVTTSARADLVSRFEREARAASSLNHPNIVTIYDVGSEDSLSWIAMELVDGRCLRDLLNGALETRRLLDIATQVADALAKAHASGIVHRDLKPENVMLTRDGRVKLLDFGLAKLTQPEGGVTTATVDSTAMHATTPGAVMGTVPYMSPEQVLGRNVDFASDQFSLGTMLYEMATGRHPFARASAPQTMSAIIQDEPEPIAPLNPRIPAPLRWVVERCVAKDPARRYAATDDLARDLSTIRDRLSEAFTTVVPPQRAENRTRWMGWATAVLIATAGAITLWQLERRDLFWRNPLDRATFTRLTDWPGTEADAAISADGKFVAFIADRDGAPDVWVTQLGSGEFRNLTRGQFVILNDHTVRNIGFSGDGALVWFAAPTGKERNAQEIWVVPTLGGTARRFLAPGVEVAWSPDRKNIVYHTNAPGDPTFIADANGRNPRLLFQDKPQIHAHFPTFSRDGRYVYFTRAEGLPPSAADIWRIPAAGGNAERVTGLTLITHPSVVSDRVLFFKAPRENQTGTGLYAVDVRRRLPHAVSLGLEEYASISASGDGQRLVASIANPSRNLFAVPISDAPAGDAAVTPVPVPSVRAAAPRFGPDYLLYLSSSGQADGIWKVKNGSATELWNGRDGAVVAPPSIAAGGDEIAFIVDKSGRGVLYRMAADGTGAQAVTTSMDVPGNRGAPAWSPDGKWLVVAVKERDGFPLMKVSVDGRNHVRLAGGGSRFPVWSPDGRTIIYSEAQPSGPDLVRAVTPDGNQLPFPVIRVRQRGSRYRFLAGTNDLVIEQGVIWEQNFHLLDIATGRMRPLTAMKNASGIRQFDVSPDGKQIVFDRYRDNSDVVVIDLPPR